LQAPDWQFQGDIKSKQLAELCTAALTGSGSMWASWLMLGAAH
jgi:hypothetical protein